MTGNELRSFRESRSMGQADLAAYLNAKLGRKYDRNRVSRWENGQENIPRPVAVCLAEADDHSGIPAAITGPAMVVALVNQKGGVGKTTSTVNIAWLLGKAGKRTLVIDCDPQANATIHLGVDPHERDVARATLTHVMFHELAMESAVLAVCDGMIELLPASISLASADAELLKEPNGTLLLREKIDNVRGEYDFILIDCPPNLGQMTVSALNAADQVIIPSQTEMLSIMGIPMLLETLSKVRRRVNPRIAVLGVLPTLHNPRRLQDQTMMGELDALAGNARLKLYSPVKDAADYAKGVTAGRPALSITPGVAGNASYAEVVADLLALADSKQEPAHVA